MKCLKTSQMTKACIHHFLKPKTQQQKLEKNWNSRGERWHCKRNGKWSAEAPADLAAMIRLKLTEALTVQLGRAPTEEELNEMMEGYHRTKAIHRCLLSKFCRFSPDTNKYKKRPSEFDENLLQLSSKTQVTCAERSFTRFYHCCC